MKSKDFISTVYKDRGLTDSYSETLAKLTQKKVKGKVEASVGDVVLLVTKKGYENVSGHVGTVTAVTDNDYTFDMLFAGEKKKFTLPYNFLAKKGLVTVGFYTVK